MAVAEAAVPVGMILRFMTKATQELINQYNDQSQEPTIARPVLLRILGQRTGFDDVARTFLKNMVKNNTVETCGFDSAAHK